MRFSHHVSFSRALFLTAFIIACLHACATSLRTEDTTAADQVIPVDSDECPVLESTQWRAWIDGKDSEAGFAKLNVSGDIVLPNGGYQYDMVSGLLDRRQPPSIRIRLVLTKLDGMAIQALETKNVTYQETTQVLQFRSVIVICGQQQLTEIFHVMLEQG